MLIEIGSVRRETKTYPVSTGTPNGTPLRNKAYLCQKTKKVQGIDRVVCSSTSDGIGFAAAGECELIESCPT